MASGMYSNGLSEMAAGNIDWDADTIKVMLVATGYTLNKETHDNLSDVSSNRYTSTTDQTLGTKTNTVDTGNNRVELSGAAVTYSSVALNASDDAIGVIVYKDTGVASTSTLLAFDDSSNVTPNGSDITYTPNAEGIMQFDYGA